MKNILTVIVLTFYIQITFGQNQEIVCSLSAENRIVNLGETPQLKLIFENKTDSTIYLIKSLDASSYKWRYPYAYYTIEKLDDEDYKMERYSRCGNMDGIDSTDFVKIEPNDKFDPIKFNHFYFSDFSVRNPNNFKNKGKYKITFHYSTKSKNLNEYMGDDMSMGFYEIELIYGDSINPPKIVNKINNENQEKFLLLEELFSKVPKIEIESNSIVIVVK